MKYQTVNYDAHLTTILSLYRLPDKSNGVLVARSDGALERGQRVHQPGRPLFTHGSKISALVRRLSKVHRGQQRRRRHEEQIVGNVAAGTRPTAKAEDDSTRVEQIRVGSEHAVGTDMQETLGLERFRRAVQCWIIEEGPATCRRSMNAAVQCHAANAPRVGEHDGFGRYEKASVLVILHCRVQQS
jgi:hypothetical protein